MPRKKSDLGHRRRRVEIQHNKRRRASLPLEHEHNSVAPSGTPGEMSSVCQYCKTVLLSHQAPGICCAGGTVELPTLVSPPEPQKSLVSETVLLTKPGHRVTNVSSRTDRTVKTRLVLQKVKEEISSSDDLNQKKSELTSSFVDDKVKVKSEPGDSEEILIEPDIHGANTEVNVNIEPEDNRESHIEPDLNGANIKIKVEPDDYEETVFIPEDTHPCCLIHECEDPVTVTLAIDDLGKSPIFIDDNNYKCDWTGCGAVFQFSHLLDRHRLTHTSIQRYMCDYTGCNLSFGALPSLKDHMGAHLSESQNRPDIDGSSSYSQSESDVRRKPIFTDDEFYKCDWEGCDAQFQFSYVLDRHLVTHTGIERYKCEVCNQTFKLQRSLRSHMKIHSGAKTYNCNYPGCSSSFACSQSLKFHKRIHSGDKPYKCLYPDCKSSFTTSNCLKFHMRLHMGDRPYKCDYIYCRASFIMLSHLKSHVRIHTGEKPYKCDYSGCSSSFTTGSSLKIHKRVHTGEKPYKCDYTDCNSSFNQSNNLKVHRRFHTGEKPYKCDYSNCNLSFTTSTHLKHHMKIHTNEKT